ncbi:DMT family transporter [Rhizobiales bacterium]|uniref:DMT family transporter n=1 Tax=Hongsoonwoonella zoysiae TaxID=2821844 RepID=UPI00155FB0AF|nr:DMT family transporter [Hongsoonwoonella zoysiae]NRG19284.1 DMT family transporter [Hongsoonwoonella zoysiae]
MHLLDKPYTGHMAQVLSISVWSTGLIVQKSLTDIANPASILMLQFTGAAVILWTGLALGGLLPRADGRAFISFLWGTMAPAMVLIFGLFGAARTDGVSVSLIWGLVPLLGPVLARLALKEPLPWTFVAGGFISFAGLLLITANREAIGASDMTGNALVFIGVLFAAGSHVVGRFLNRGAVPWYQTATLQVTGAAFATGCLVAWTGFRFNFSGELEDAWSVAYLVLIMTVVNFLAFNLALSRIPAAWVSLYVSLAPAIGTLASVVLLGTIVRPVDIAAIAVIMSGVALPHVARLATHRAQATKP